MPIRRLVFFSIAGDRSVSRPSRRARTEDLPSMRCPRKALPRRSFPLPVTLIRFLAPLSVFIFGISSLLYRYFGRNTRRDFMLFFDFRALGHLRLRLLFRSEDHDHVATIEFRGRLDLGDVVEFVDDSVQDLLSEFGVSRLASAEHDGDLHLVTNVEKLLDEAGC